MTDFAFEPQQRLQIINILPQDAGSLRESIQVKRLRDRVQFSDEEKETLDLDEQTGSFDPQKLSELEAKEITLGDNEKEILAGAIIQMEDEGSVPTNDSFVELALQLEEEIKEFRESLDPTEE